MKTNAGDEIALDLDLAISELHHAASIGLHAVSMPTGVPEGLPDYNRDHWEPLWSAAEESGMVLAFHIGSDNDGNDNTNRYLYVSTDADPNGAFHPTISVIPLTADMLSARGPRVGK